MLHFYRTPAFLKKISENLIWNINTINKEIYLTFDDGPIPSLTEYILEVLSQYDAKATFFCVGENIVKYPNIFQAIVQRGHAIGNHTFNHLKGWSNSTSAYLQNVDECQALINNKIDQRNHHLFRPPNGQLFPGQINALKNKYKIIMWDVLGYDFEESHAPKLSLEKIIQKTTKGSITVFHDNYKAEFKLKYMLYRYIEHFKSLDYQFKKLN